MSSYKYVLPRFSLQAKIQRLECVKETAKFVTLIDRFDCEEKRSKANGVFDTWEEAHAALTRIVEAELNTARLRLQYLQGIAGNVRGMKPPGQPVAIEPRGCPTPGACSCVELPAPVPVAVSGWQPIDTAPKDGTEILASDYDAIEIVSYEEVSRCVFEWTNRECEQMFPAWWQPLPDHPELPLPGEEVE